MKLIKGLVSTNFRFFKVESKPALKPLVKVIFNSIAALAFLTVLLACEPQALLSYPYDDQLSDKSCIPALKESKLMTRLVTEQVMNLTGGSVNNENPSVLFQASPMYRESLELVFSSVEKNNDEMTTVVVCVANDHGVYQALDNFPLDKTLLRKTYESLRGSRLSIQLSGQGEVGVDVIYAKNEGQAWRPPSRDASIPAKGFLDLHLHQTGAMAFNNGWYWGSHRAGSLEERLPACDGEHGSMHEYEHYLDKPVSRFIAYKIAPKHDVDDFLRSHRDQTATKDYVRSNNRKHQQVAFERLKEAHDRGLNLIISTVVENHVLLDLMRNAGKGRMDLYPSVMESIKRQIFSLRELDEQADWFEVVYDPWHARRAIAAGKLAVVIGAEFSDIFPKTDGPWRQQLYDLYDLGLRHLQPVHKLDSQFSSTHDQGFPFDLVNVYRAFVLDEIPLKPALIRFMGESDPSIGMTQAGFELIDEMVRLNMIVDLSHASKVSQGEMTDYLLEKHHYYPFIYSHWKARSFELLEKLKQAGGMIPFGWGQPVPVSEREISPAKAQTCDGFLQARLEKYRDYIDYGVNFSLSTDMNGFTSTMQPNFGPLNCQLSEDDKDRSDQTKTIENMKRNYPNQPDWMNRYWAQGTADISLLPGVVYEMNEVLGEDMSVLESSTENFIKMWERTYDAKRSIVK